MNVLIIEDEHLAAERLQSKLIEIQPDINVLGVTESVLDTINWLNEQDRPDLIFMDVQLDDGICFEIFDSVQVETPIIFTTAYDRYAIQAFQVNSVDYLLKPIEEEALRRSLDKFSSLYAPKQDQKIKALFDHLILV